MTVPALLQHMRALRAAALLAALVLALSACSSAPSLPAAELTPTRPERSILNPPTPGRGLPTRAINQAVSTPPPSVPLAAALTPTAAAAPSKTAFPTATTSSTPSSTAPPEPSPTQTPTPTRQPTARLVRLTEGGCCSQPFWSPDGQYILFLDRPEPEGAWGLWQVSITGGSTEFYAPLEGTYSEDMSLLAFPSRGQTFVERLSDGEIWMIPAGGREVYFSPDSRSVAWTKGSGSGSINSALREVWVSGSDGSEANMAASVYGGGFAGWFPDGRLLVYGRTSPTAAEAFYWALSPESGEMQTLAEGFRLRGAMVSPSGEWLAYQSVFSSETEENGIWLVNTYTFERRRLDIYGAYRWTAGDRLILAPLEEGAYYHRLLEADPSSGTVRQLTRPEDLPFRIANGDWSISPDGSRVIFVSAEDFNIWMVEFEH